MIFLVKYCDFFPSLTGRKVHFLGEKRLFFQKLGSNNGDDLFLENTLYRLENTLEYGEELNFLF